MKKSLIALAALSAFATAAQAQSSVTVYGVVDMGYGSKDYSNNNYTAGANGTVQQVQGGALSSQRLGFRGTEDLGGGLTANFVMESTAGADTNLSNGREYRVGLSSKTMGSLEIGKSKTVSQLMMERYTAGGANNWVGEAWNYGADTTDFGSGVAKVEQLPVKDFTQDRATGFHYNSPVMSGIAVGLTYANTTNKDQNGAASLNTKSVLQDIALVYTGVQNLSIGVSQGTEKSRAATATAETTDKVTQFGASYVFGPATVYGQYVKAENESTAGAQTRALDGTQFGVKYAVNAKVTLHAQMGSVDEESTAGTKTHDRESTQFGAQYAFSKRTTGYVMYGTQESKLLSSGVTNEVKGYVAGVRHSF
jgi:predicted porin